MMRLLKTCLKLLIIKKIMTTSDSTTNSTNNLQLNDVTKFRLDEINKVKDYFNTETKERKQIIKKTSKFITTFDYADKVFIVLSASFGSLSIASHATVVGIPVGIAVASLTLVFTACTGVVKKLLSVSKKEKKKHNKIMVLASNGLNVIETLLSSALSDYDISPEEFAKIINDKIKYEDMKENAKNVVKLVQETEI